MLELAVSNLLDDMMVEMKKLQEQLKVLQKDDDNYKIIDKKIDSLVLFSANVIKFKRAWRI